MKKWLEDNFITIIIAIIILLIIIVVFYAIFYDRSGSANKSIFEEGQVYRFRGNGPEITPP